MNEISVFITETPLSSLATSATGYSEKTATWELESGSSLDTESASTLVLDFSVFRIVKNKFVLFISHLATVLCYCRTAKDIP